MAKVSAQLIAHALSIEWGDLPPGAQRRTLEFLGDTLAVGVAGRGAAFAGPVMMAAQRWSHRGGEAFVLGEPAVRMPAPYAAFVNAYQIHSQEFDCVHEPAVAHPMATVTAALLAEASRDPACSGRDFLAAVVAGVDVVATLGSAVKGKLKFFRPATAGIFGCVAAIARLRRLDEETARNAFGYALAYASGTMQAHVEGKPALALQVAGAARCAIEAVDLAVAGIPGPQQAIEGPFGYASIFESKVSLAPELEKLGKVYRIEEVSWKPFPTGRAAHGAIVALQSLVQSHQVSADNLESFEYIAPPLIKRLVGRKARSDMTIAYARLCFPWLAAVLLRDGAVSLDAFTTKNVRDPALLKLAGRISISVNDNTDQAAFAPATGTAVLQSGKVIRVDVADQYGSPAWPLTEAEQLAKWQECCIFGGLPGREDALKLLIDRFDTLDDAAAAVAETLSR